MSRRQDASPSSGVGNQVSVIVVAAGKSKRMGGVDKIFAPLLGTPLIAHTVEVFEVSRLVQELVLVLPPEKVDAGIKLAQERKWRKVTAICAGGLCRQASVRNGLEHLAPCDWVLVHDGARPCLDRKLIQRGLTMVKMTGAAIAAIPATETIKLVSSKGVIESTPDRENLWIAQTPQIFNRQLLLNAHRAHLKQATDDASLVEALGIPVNIFMGSHHNLKVTTTQDLAIAEMLIKMKIEKEGAACRRG